MKATGIATKPQALGNANVIDTTLFFETNQDVPHGAHR